MTSSSTHAENSSFNSSLAAALGHPSYWGSSVAAYIFAGESYREAAERRLREELGIRRVALEFVGKTSMVDQASRKFIAVFTGRYDGPFIFDRRHIATLEFLSLHAIHALHTTGSRKFTPTFLKVLSFYESKIWSSGGEN
jgi:isopentenyl-diphosphate Delta-isomerase